MTINQDPISIFSKWFREELEASSVQIPTAVCLSTCGADNFPNARFVSFKELVDNSFVVTGPLNSRKGLEVEQNPQVALTFWWAETERQVRVQGIASTISDELADRYFSERNPAAKAVSAICEQGSPLSDTGELEKAIAGKVALDEIIPRPAQWGGFIIQPVRIELMEFRSTRLHDRQLYEAHGEGWKVTQIQP